MVGGGDTAAEDALFLTRYAKEVSIIHRRDQLRASKIMQDRLHRNEKIKFIWNSKVEDILDADKREVSGIKLRNLKTEEETLKPVDGVFIGIGHEPNTSLFRGQLDVDDLGYLITREGSKTKIPGRFCRRGRQRPRLPASHHRGGVRMHGRHGRGEISGSGALTDFGFAILDIGLTAASHGAAPLKLRGPRQNRRPESWHLTPETWHLLMLRSLLLYLSERESPKKLLMGNSLGRRLASRFIAGEELEDALRVIRRLNS